MLNIGPMELILILVIVLIVFGPGKMPEVARGLGKAVREFRKASAGVQQMWNDVTQETEVSNAVTKDDVSTGEAADFVEENESVGPDEEKQEQGEEGRAS
jgi:sec-independent protein translocase protein TatA